MMDDNESSLYAAIICVSMCVCVTSDKLVLEINKCHVAAIIVNNTLSLFGCQSKDLLFQRYQIFTALLECGRVGAEGGVVGATAGEAISGSELHNRFLHSNCSPG